MTNKQDAGLQDLLRQEYTIDTPENVTFGYDVAGIGSRAIGAAVDTVIIFILLVTLDVLLFMAVAAAGGEEVFWLGLESNSNWVVGLTVALYALFQFLIYAGYYIFFEMLWNGRTPGKRFAHTRAVRLDGEPAGFMEVAVRNLVRLVDFMPIAYGVGVLVMLLNEKSRRLGDYAAGTIVVRDDSGIQLSSLAPIRPPVRIRPAGETPTTLDYDLRKLTHQDYTLLRDAMAREEAGKLPMQTLHRLAVALATKVGAPAPGRDRVPTRSFLVALGDAYDQRGRSQP